MTLPSQKTPPILDPGAYAVLIHSPPKFGKSRWCAQAEHALFLATEPGLSALSVYQMSIGSWEDFLYACDELTRGEHPFKNLVIDTVDGALRLCGEYICKKYHVAHESDLGYGKGAGLIATEFLRVFTKLRNLPYGLCLVSHSQDREIVGPSGRRTRVVSALPEKVRLIVLGLVDFILYGDLVAHKRENGEITCQRVLRTKPSPFYEAGDRTGLLPPTLPPDYPSFHRALLNSLTLMNGGLS